MGFISDLFDKADNILSGFIQPVIDIVVNFLSNSSHTVIAVIGFFASLLLIVGLFRWLRKMPKLFITLVLIFGIVVGAWFISK